MVLAYPSVLRQIALRDERRDALREVGVDRLVVPLVRGALFSMLLERGELR